MMKYDWRRLQITTDSADVIDAINHFAQQVMSAGTEANKVLNAVEKHPENFLLHCYTAAFYLYAQKDEETSKALLHLQQAEKLLKYVTDRERLTYQAIRAWKQLNYELAITLFTSITALWPRDCLAAKMAEWMFYCSGQAYQSQRFLAMCEKMSKENNDNSHFMAIHSFALELNGNYAEAHALALRALKIEAITPWAHHTLSHILLLKPEIDSDTSAFEHYRSSWDNIFPLLRGHNNWHLGLLYLAKLKIEKAKEIYQQNIWGNLPNTVLQQIDAISFLWRMDMLDQTQESEWKIIKKYIPKNPTDHYTPFHNAHFIYALARTHGIKAAEDSLKTLKEYASNLSGTQYYVWHTISLPLFAASIAFVEKNYKKASELLAPIIQEVFCLGGSDAQDELFLQMYFVSLLKSNKLHEAKQFFDKFLSHYHNTALGQYWFNK